MTSRRNFMASALQVCTPEYTETLPRDAAFMAAFEENVRQTIGRFRLFRKDDKVLVAVSGGKDSTVLLWLLKKLGYDVEAFTVDVAIGCYTRENLANIRRLCSEWGVRLHEAAFREEYGASVCYIREMLRQQGQQLTSCHICGVLRRAVINKHGRDIRPTVVATGHNLDDEAQSVLMNLLRNRPGQNARIGPRSGSESIGGRLVPRVKPLYLTAEADVERYARMMGFRLHYGRCPCSHDSFRASIRKFFAAAEAKWPGMARRLLERFLAIQPALQKAVPRQGTVPCTACGEPSSTGTCRTCQLLASITPAEVTGA
jgi:uncharacterized protein (TIGR00269 family)